MKNLSALALLSVLLSTHMAQAETVKPEIAKSKTDEKTVETKSDSKPVGQTAGEDDFESGVVNWTPFKIVRGAFNQDVGARVETTEKAALVRSGKRSLSYIYEAAPETLCFLAQLAPVDLSQMNGARFSIRADAPTIMAFIFQEKSGARYQTFFYAPANKWQDVKFDFSEMRLAEDTTDPNGALDLGELQGYAVADVAGMMMQPGMGQEGDRILFLDDFSFTSERVASDVSTRNKFSVDDFSSSLVRWLPATIQLKPAFAVGIADANLKVQGKADSRALVLNYERAKDQVSVLMRYLSDIKIKSADLLNFGLQTAHDGLFLVSLREKDGTRYEKTVELKKDDGWKEFSLPLGEFKVADDSKDENSQLDLSQLQELAIGDITPLIPETLGKGPQTGKTSLQLRAVTFGIGL